MQLGLSVQDIEVGGSGLTKIGNLGAIFPGKCCHVEGNVAFLAIEEMHTKWWDILDF